MLAACTHNDTAKAPPPPPAPAKPIDLTGAPFTLSAIAVDGKEIPLPGTRRPTMQFAEGNRVSGLAGVNRYSTQATITGQDGVSFGPAISTKMAGPPEAMALEAGFFNALGAITRFRTEGPNLKLSNADGTTRLEFTR